ncbi:histone deacetylase [Myxococcota bacterium]|nr:histone deacetylase [Myxococcota bacterium]
MSSSAVPPAAVPPRPSGFFRGLRHRIEHFFAPDRPLPIFHDPAYRLPLTTASARLGLEPRRADFALWFLESRKRLTPGQVRTPPRIGYDALARVHSPAWLETLGAPEVLGDVFGIEPWDVPVDGLMTTVRLACGGTLAAARLAVREGGPVANLLGGFHHAYPDRGAGLCPVNDVAVAVAVLRDEGFTGRIGVLDLDAHPPDGTAACLRDTVWHGSLSGSDWGHLEHVDETVLPERADDATYLRALDALLNRMPDCDLVFVLAGGDVLANDPMGRLGMTLAGAWERDRRVATRLGETPAVWLPAGGYQAEAWKVLVGTLYVLIRGRPPRLAGTIDPLRERYRRVAASLPADRLGGGHGDATDELDFSDVEIELGLRRAWDGRLLGFYTREGIELALFRLGLLAHLERLGYRDFRVEITVDGPDPGDRLRLWGRFEDEPKDAPGHILVEALLEKQTRQVPGPVLYVHWLALRHPRSAFAQGRPALPGQDVPGLGLAHEAQAMLGNMAIRLGLRGVVVRPAWFHVAYVGRSRFRFLDALAQGTFDALVRDLRADPELCPTPDAFALARASREVAAGHMICERLDPETGAVLSRLPYVWPADEVLDPVVDGPPEPAWAQARALVAARTRFVRVSPV